MFASSSCRVADGSWFVGQLLYKYMEFMTEQALLRWKISLTDLSLDLKLSISFFSSAFCNPKSPSTLKSFEESCTPFLSGDGVRRLGDKLKDSVTDRDSFPFCAS